MKESAKQGQPQTTSHARLSHKKFPYAPYTQPSDSVRFTSHIAEEATDDLAMSLALPAIEVICRQGGRVAPNLFCQCLNDMRANFFWPFGIATIDLSKFELKGKAQTTRFSSAGQKRHFVGLQQPKIVVEFVPRLGHSFGKLIWFARIAALHHGLLRAMNIAAFK